MSFLSDNFSDDMKTLQIERKTQSKNSLGETVNTPAGISSFSGIIITKRYGSDTNIQGDVPVHSSAYTLYTDFITEILRDDIIIDGSIRYVVKDVGVQEDFWGKNDCQRISLDLYV